MEIKEPSKVVNKHASPSTIEEVPMPTILAPTPMWGKE